MMGTKLLPSFSTHNYLEQEVVVLRDKHGTTPWTGSAHTTDDVKEFLLPDHLQRMWTASLPASYKRRSSALISSGRTVLLARLKRSQT